MKKKFLLTLALVFVLSCLFVISVSAEIDYSDAPERVNIEVRQDDIVVFDDGFSCPSAYIFKDSKTTANGSWSVGFNDATDFSYINGKTGKSYTFANVVELDIPQGITYVGKYSAYYLTTLKKVSIPDSVVTLGQSIFEGASGLEECVFEHDANDSLTTIPTYMFFRCSSLKAISLPDCIKKITGTHQFSNCTNLTAVHLPANLEVMEGGTQNAATFDGCKLMYFVNSPFSYDSIPEKPSIYYFPKNFSTIGNGCIFRNCNSLNQYLVFDTAMKEIPNLYTFENSAGSTIVFLGETENIVTGGWKATNIIFANKNVVDDEGAGLSRTGMDGNNLKTWGGQAFFCYAEGNTAHVKELSKTTEATCTLPAMTADYCFCGQPFGAVTEYAPALGHSYTGAVNYVIPSLTEAVTKCTVCVNNCGIDKEETLAPVYTELGYSVMGFGDSGYSFTNGYNVNLEALNAYEAQNGVTIKFGFGFNAANSFATEGEVTLESFKYTTYPADQSNGVKFSMHEFKLNYADNTHLADDIVIAAYVLEVKGENETLSFINRGQGAANGFETINYNQALEKADK